MIISSIFEIVNERLLSIKLDGMDADEWTELFRKWNDIEYLESFFEENKKILQTDFWGYISVEEAVLQTLNEAEELERFILKIAKKGSNEQEDTLGDLVFKPLSKNETDFQHTKSKAYGIKKVSWLRIYAIQISPTIYVVSGGGIKLKPTIQDCKNLHLELTKLDLTKKYLQDIDLYDETDLPFIEISKKT